MKLKTIEQRIEELFVSLKVGGENVTEYEKECIRLGFYAGFDTMMEFLLLMEGCNKNEVKGHVESLNAQIDSYLQQNQSHLH